MQNNSTTQQKLIYALSKLNIASVSILISILAITGCATPEKKTTTQRFFWPPLPDTPRIEYLKSYWSDDDLPKTAGQKWLESVAGHETRRLARPMGIYSDEGRKVYITDPEANEVVVVDYVKNEMHALGKEEYAGLFLGPVGVTLDGDGNIYISDPKKDQVFVFTNDEKPLRNIGSAENLKWPVGMVVDNKLKRLYVANAQRHNIGVFELSGKYLFSIGKRGKGDGELNYPVDVDLDSHRNIVVSDSMNARVQIFDPEGKFIRKFGQRGDGIMDFQAMKGIAVDKATDNIYVVDGRLSKVLVFSWTGEALTRFGGEAAPGLMRNEAPGGFVIPQDAMIDKKGELYIADSVNHRFQVFKIIDDEWLKEHPIKEGEAAIPPVLEDKDKGKKKK